MALVMKGWSITQRSAVCAGERLISRAVSSSACRISAWFGAKKRAWKPQPSAERVPSALRSPGLYLPAR
jgi:hypothetical protein